MSDEFIFIDAIKLKIPDGLASDTHNLITPAEALVAANIQLDKNQKVAFLGCGYGFSAITVCLRAAGTRITLTDITSSTLDICSQIFELNSFHEYQIIRDISMLPYYAGSLDAVIILLPKGRSHTRRWLLEGFHLLKPSGRIYLAGSNDMGIKSAVKDLSTLGMEINVLGYKKGNRLVAGVKKEVLDPEIQWHTQPGIQPGSWIQVKNDFGFNPTWLYSLPGVFSAEKIDLGSGFLLENLPPVQGKKVLDFGCGYGVIGICASTSGAAWVDMVDNNLYAIACARKNVLASGKDNINVIESDGLSRFDACFYDLVLSNPPFHLGKKVDYATTREFLQGSYEIIKPGGKLVVVANQFIRYDRLMRIIFGNVQCLASNNSYRIWSTTKAL